jgi:regulator of replication initiation timing
VKQFSSPEKTLDKMKNTCRTTRSQQQGRPLLPGTTSQPPDKLREETPEMIILSNKIDSLTTANQKLEDSFKFFMDEFCMVKQQAELGRLENAALKAENERLRKNMADVFSDMDYLMGKVERIDQKILSKDVEISGVPASNDEDLGEVLHQLFREVNYEPPASTTTDIYRLKENNKSGLPGSIIVTFTSNAEKANFLRETKKKQLTSSFLSTNHRQRPVYVNDHMTRQNKYLFYLARNLKRQGLIKYAWFDNGRVLVKQTDGSPSIVVECPKTLDSFEEPTNK